MLWSHFVQKDTNAKEGNSSGGQCYKERYLMLCFRQLNLEYTTSHLFHITRFKAKLGRWHPLTINLAFT